MNKIATKIGAINQLRKMPYRSL